MFDRAIFEPSDAELNVKSKTVVFKNKSKRKGKGKAKTVPRAQSEGDGVDVIDDEVEEISDDEDDGEDMDDFIVADDEDPEADFQPRKSRKAVVDEDDAPAPGKSSRRKHFIVLDSDDEEEDPEVKEVVFGKKKKPVNESPDEPQFSFLASTKLKYMMSQLQKLFDEKPDEKVCCCNCLSSLYSLFGRSSFYHSGQAVSTSSPSISPTRTSPTSNIKATCRPSIVKRQFVYSCRATRSASCCCRSSVVVLAST